MKVKSKLESIYKAKKKAERIYKAKTCMQGKEYEHKGNTPVSELSALLK